MKCWMARKSRSLEAMSVTAKTSSLPSEMLQWLDSFLLIFAPMDDHSLDPLEQQIFMDDVYVCLLFCKDEHRWKCVL